MPTWFSGRLNPDYFLGGEMRVYPELSAGMIEEKIAVPLGLSLERAAEGILRVINASMVRGIRRVSVERGFDPRDFVLECFGGAGPLHAVELARELLIPKVIIPIRPGLNSALGLLIADMRYDFMKTYIKRFNQCSLEDINRYYEEMETTALGKLQGEITKANETVMVRSADVRYFGQGHELEVPVPSRLIREKDLNAIRSKYHESHRGRFGYDIPSYELEFVNLRVAIIGKLQKPKIRKSKLTKSPIVQKAIKGERKVFLNGKWQSMVIYDRSHLVPGNRLKGPCIVEQMDSTTLLNQWDKGLFG